MRLVWSESGPISASVRRATSDISRQDRLVSSATRLAPSRCKTRQTGGRGTLICVVGDDMQVIAPAPSAIVQLAG